MIASRPNIPLGNAYLYAICKPVIPGGSCTKKLKEEIGIRRIVEKLICNSNKAMCEAKKAEKSQYAFCEKDQ